MAQTNATGKLRTKWVAVLTAEFCFRDTVHGFLAWAFASFATSVFLTPVIGDIVSGGIQAGASVAGSRMERGGHG